MPAQKWRFIYSHRGDPYFNMAVDEALVFSVQHGSVPILRAYEWDPPGISIGYFQNAHKTVDVDQCLKHGVKLVRRITGGRAVLHHQELTYSFTGSSGIFPELGNTTFETYKKISQALLCSLSLLGIEAQWVKPSDRIPSRLAPAYEGERRLYAGRLFDRPCFSSLSRYEVSSQGRKLIGSAQRRFRDVFLQHGSILLGRGLDLTDFLPARPLNEGVRLPENSITIQEIKGEIVKCDAVVQALKRGFSEVFHRVFEEDSLTEEEINTAEELLAQKYSQDSWNLRY